MSKKQIHILVGALILFIVLIAIAYLTSVPAKSSVSSAIANCAAVKLGFTYNTSTEINALIGTYTYGLIYVSSTGNVTQNISLSALSHSSLKIRVAPSFILNISGKTNGRPYTEYEIASPQIVGNYTANMTLTSRYDNCLLSKSFITDITVTKSSVNSST